MSRIEMPDPNRERENTVRELPYLPTLRRARELPSIRKSRIATDEPNLESA
jgi:hypothetical protein